MRGRAVGWWAAGFAALGFAGSFVGAAASAQAPAPAARTEPLSAERVLVNRYCVTCHNPRTNTGGLALDAATLSDVGASAEVWEKVVRKLRAGAMPPAGAPRPEPAAYRALLSHLEDALDRAAAAHPDPGRTDTFRRLNRTEYRNAIRDLLALDVDVADLLPRDDASYGFDNVSVGGLSPTLMERYLSAAQKVSRLAVGGPVSTPASHVVVLPPDLTQERHFAGLPFGTRGGVRFDHTFPLDGDYQIRVRLSRDRNENVEGLTEPHQMEITLDGERLREFTITPNRNRMDQYYADESVDRGLDIRVRVTSGPHAIGVTFFGKNAALVETERQPYQAFFNMDRSPRVQPAVRSVSIEGPFDPTGAGDTPSRDRIFICRPASAAEEPACARTILSTLARRAYRRPVGDQDVSALFAFYDDAQAEAGFEAGIEMAVRALLTSTEFLFRVERDPGGIAPGTPYRLSPVELASRLSFFLWSSIPDEALMEAAVGGTLHDPAVLATEVRRMLADPKAGALTTNFAGQWLHLRNLDAAIPDARLFPEFDENLRRAFRSETELLFASVVDEDRNVLDLLRADYTFLNERLAKHYGVPHVYGDHFRRVSLDRDSPRAGVLGHGSVLTVTSYATRTSPVLRGKWILDTVLGMPPPPPPANVPPLGDNRGGSQALTMRERMVQHRANPACAACHQLMDPAGLAMENFDAIGRWRTKGESGAPIDASGSLPGGATFDGVAGLREALLARPEPFVVNLTEKLLTYALGRGIDYRDQPAVRAIVRQAAHDDYRFSGLVLALTESPLFQMRRTE